MKIVHVMNWYVPGMGYQENYLPSEQKKLGVDVEIITSDRVPEYRGYERSVGNIIGERRIGAGVFEENNVKIHRLPSLFEIELNGQIVLKGLTKKLKQIKPDIVQAHGAFSPVTLQVIILSKSLNYNVFVDDHSHKNNFHINTLSKRIYLSLTKIFYHFYEERVCYWMPVTHSSGQILQSILKIPDEKIALLPLGANTFQFKKSMKLRKSGRSECNIKDDSLVIISSGKFDESKDIHFLIKAFEKIVEKYPNVFLLLLGDGPEEYMTKLTNMVNSSGLNKNVIFKNFVKNSELPKYYNTADIGIWPGDHSITVIEAVATGLPVIVPEGDYAYQILIESKACICFERGNIDSLSMAMLELIENPNIRYILTENSSNLVDETLSWNKVAEKSISIYSSRGSKYVFKS
jgi:glycosyltransferase involved in cell wall biosynthesis